MKKYKMILDILYEKCPLDLQKLVEQLEQEVKDFYFKLDLYYNYKQNQIIFSFLTDKKKEWTKEAISLEVPLDIKRLNVFIKNNDDFVISLIHSKNEYHDLLRFLPPHA